MFDRTRDNLQQTCGELYQKTERGIRILRRLYFFEIALLLIVGGVIGVFVSLYAAPNKSFTYSGRVTGSDFLPLTDGTYYMRISLWNALTSGTCAWSTGALTTGANCNDANAIASVPTVLTRSLFSLPIGDTGYNANMPNLASLDFKNNTYFLEVAFATTQSGTYQTLAPRTKLGAAASAVTVLDTLQANTFNQIPGTYTQLNGAVTDSATTMVVDSTAGYPSAGTLLIDNEAMTYTATTATTFTGVVRARLGTVAAAHNDNATVKTYLLSGMDGTVLASATLTDNPLTNSATTANVNSTTGYPTSGSIKIDNEIMSYTGITATSFTGLTRAVRSSTAASHNLSATITLVPAPVFHITSDGNAFINSNNATINPSINFQVDGTTRYSFGIDRNSNNNILKLGTTAPTTSTLLSIDSRTALSGGSNSTYLFSGPDITLTASSASNTYSTFTISPATTTVAGTNITALDATRINQPIIAAPSQIVGDASTLAIEGPPLLQSGTLTNAYGLKINSVSVGSVTNAYGLSVAAPTGATNNYTAIFTGPTTAGTGTLTTTGTTTVTGSGTAFLTQLQIGDSITAGGQTQRITAIATNTSLTIATAFSPNLSGHAFTFTNPAKNARVGIGTTAPIAQLHVPSAIPSTHLATIAASDTWSIDIQGHYAYVTAPTGNTIRVFDISNLSSPFQIVTITPASSSQPKQIQVQGRYAYVLVGNTLQIFDTSNPSALTGTAIGVSNSISTPNGLFVQGRYAYIVGTTNPGELTVVDISRPSSPTIISTTNTLPILLHSIYVQGRYAYIEAGNTTDSFAVYDISNPTSPTRVNTTDPGKFGISGIGSNTSSHSLTVQGRYAYVVSAGGNTLSVVDIKDPALPSVVGTVATTTTAPNAVAVQGRYAFVANNANPGSIQIIDISSPTAPLSIGSISTSTTGASALAVHGRSIFAGVGSAFRVYDIGGSYIQQMEVGGLEIADGQVRSNFTIFNDLDVRGGVNIGLGGLYSAGPLSVTGLEGASGAQAALDVRDSTGASVFFVQNSGKIGFATTLPTYDLSFGAAHRTVGVESQTGSNAGNNLLLQAGNSGSGNNVAGGNLIFRSGNSTGTGISKVQISVPMSNTTPSNSNSANTFFEFVNGHIASMATGFTPALPSVSSCTNGILGTAATLSGDHTNAITTITVNSTVDYPSSGTLIIDSEIMTYTATSGGNQFTGVTRATNGTTASTHSNTTSVRLYPASTDVSGKVLFTGTSSACTLQFAKSYTNTPSCIATFEDLDNSGSVSVRTTASGVSSVTFGLGGTVSANDKLSYFCIGLGSQ